MLRKHLTKLNDNGWRLTTASCLAGAAVAISRIKTAKASGVAGAIIGTLCEQTVEWAAHGWLQSEPVEGFEFFRWRHGRHHRDPETHHALQPISIWVPTVAMMLAPAILGSRHGGRRVRSFCLGGIAGFLSAHAVLNIEHFDIHAKEKIVPNRIRQTRYYREVERIHLAHHNGSTQRIYGITNPWLDMFYQRLGLTALMDRLFVRAGRRAKNLDPLWLLLDPIWRQQRERRARGSNGANAQQGSSPSRRPL